MKRMITTAATALLFVACGGDAKKDPNVATAPTAPAAATTEAPSETASAASGTGTGTGTGTPPADSPPAASSTAAAPASSTAGIVAEGHDDCTAIAAPFEEKVRAKFNECYQTGKKKNPELAGTIKVTLKVDTKGKIKYVVEPSKLDKAPHDCMVNAVKKEPFDAKQCKGKDVAVSKTFGS